MYRTQVIQKLLNRRKSPTYLEIGMGSGINFFSIKTRRKIAIDPKFSFTAKDRIQWMFKNPDNFLAKCHKMTSDFYFAHIQKSHQFEVVFIDGLHTYIQSLKDFNNSLACLKKDGVIIMHDCLPPNEQAAYPAQSYDDAASLNLSGWNGWWSGDVWKTICHLRSTRQDLRIFVLDCDSGLGIITKGEPDYMLNLSPSDVDSMTFKEFSQNKAEFLNLHDEDFFLEFLETF
jgi:hypothetical protein